MAGTTEELLAEAQSHLDNFENIHNLATPYLPNNALEALELTYDELTKLSADQCAQYSYILEQYSLYLQRIVNKESATLDWLTNQLDKLVCDKLTNYDQYTKHDIKIKLIAKENNVVNNLLQQINFTKQKLARLEYIPSAIKSISKALDSIKHSKISTLRGNRNGETY